MDRTELQELQQALAPLWHWRPYANDDQKLLRLDNDMVALMRFAGHNSPERCLLQKIRNTGSLLMAKEGMGKSLLTMDTGIPPGPMAPEALLSAYDRLRTLLSAGTVIFLGRETLALCRTNQEVDWHSWGRPWTQVPFWRDLAWTGFEKPGHLDLPSEMRHAAWSAHERMIWRETTEARPLLSAIDIWYRAGTFRNTRLYWDPVEDGLVVWLEAVSPWNWRLPLLVVPPMSLRVDG